MIVWNNEQNPFFTTTEYKIELPYSFKIKWNVSNITKKEHATGYIVQLVMMDGPERSIAIPYYEAWKVVNGHTDESYGYDDKFSCEKPINYRTKVYWVDGTDNLYKAISQWKPCMQFFAGDLPAVIASEFPYLTEREPVLERVFIHPAFDPTGAPQDTDVK